MVTELRRGIAILLVLFGGWSLLDGVGHAQDDGAVYVVDVSGEIDLGLAPYLERIVEEATDAGAAAILLEIDTPGGRLDAVLQMRDTLLDSPVPTIAFIDRTALSAGALIALASETIYVAPGSSVGAATPVDGTGQPTDEKVVSAVRSLFRATAEERGRDPAIAAAMVDPDIEVEGVVARRELLTLTDREALAVGFADGEARSRDDVLEQAGLADRAVVETSPSVAESFVRVLTNPVFSSLLFTIGILLIVGELLIGSFTIAAGIGAGLLAVFFYGHLLAGLTGWEDAILVLLGIGLLLVEVFVIPGFGIAGVLGSAAVLTGGFLAMTGRDWDFVSGGQIATTAGTLLITFVLLSIAMVVTLSAMARRGRGAGPVSAAAATGGSGRPRGWLRWFGDGDVLASENDGSDDDAGGEGDGDGAKAPSPGSPAQKGAIGEALTDLRPAGVARFDGQRIDVVTEGDYIAAGQQVEVIRAERYRHVVRLAPPTPAGTPDRAPDEAQDEPADRVPGEGPAEGS
jgi:membrane-bound serine protease (ClpP class)